MNSTIQKDFHLLAFSRYEEDQPLLFMGLLMIYLTAVLGNMMIIVLVCLVSQLHTPMRHQHFSSQLLLEISCSDTSHIKQFMTVELPFVGILPFVLILTSYVYIIATIIKLQTSAAKLKAFSSCSSHLTVVLLLCGTSIGIYIRPDSQNSQEQEKYLSLLYTGVVPMLNPLVYSLRNREVWSAAQILLEKYVPGTTL
ncbi:hypothetical protein XELAEV_18018842mg [Xenopus laevis]|uniref:G-protein coupled receptors family 1 profile domain-containing protein n=1 Tax=Xenopus laevis TaxID=8355 RepID=A0A974HTY5_XENLA|nr:hypothetical protein XELAEV_18018842mg [Xenopus laevis]